MNNPTENPPAPNDDANVILSFPKSGRTWLSYLYAYYACYRVIGDSADSFIERELTPTAHIYRPLEHPALLALLRNIERPIVPPLRVAHHFEPTPYFRLDLPLAKVRGEHVAVLVRDPRDVVVSYFHHTMQRAEEARARRKTTLAPDVDLSEFIRSETYGIRAIVEYMNQMSERGPEAFDVFRIWYYEDLVSDPETLFAGILEFFRARVDMKAVQSVVARASFANLQRLEIQRRTEKSGTAPTTNALRFRRGVPGSYRAELHPPDINYLNKVIERHLDPEFARYQPSAHRRDHLDAAATI